MTTVQGEWRTERRFSSGTMKIEIQDLLYAMGYIKANRKCIYILHIY